MNPILDTLEQRIATVVECSLQYLDNVSDHMSLAESHIKYPLVEFLERKKHCKDIELEVPMKKFYYRRHDVAFKCEDQQIVMEFKYLHNAKISEHETQRIFDDILRLKYGLDDGYSRALMLICGKSEDVIPNFLGKERLEDENIPEHTEGEEIATETTQLAKWFPLSQEEDAVITYEPNKSFISEFEARYINHYKNKATAEKPYNPSFISAVSETLNIKTSLKTINITKADNSYPSYLVSIWEICNHE